MANFSFNDHALLRFSKIQKYFKDEKDKRYSRCGPMLIDEWLHSSVPKFIGQWLVGAWNAQTQIWSKFSLYFGSQVDPGPQRSRLLDVKSPAGPAQIYSYRPNTTC